MTFHLKHFVNTVSSIPPGVQAKAPPPAQKQPPRAPQILKAPSPVREVAVGNTTK